MRSKYGLALYEVIAGKINLRKSYEEISVATLRQWLGVERGKLETWSDLRRKAVEPALHEVNGLSPFAVTIEPINRGRKVERVRVSWAKKEPFSPAEQAAVREVNRAEVGRGARLAGTVERVLTLTEDQIQIGYDEAAKVGPRIDKHAAYADWTHQMKALPKQPDNPVGHWVEFCRRRARALR
jgi:plasmid replication initiation protein